MTFIIPCEKGLLYFCIIKFTYIFLTAKTGVMSVMLLLLGASLVVGLLFLIAFIWSVKTGQMDDTYSPAHKVLFDNYHHPETATNKDNTTTTPSEEDGL